jgi:guanine nucleotide-binding protein G(I)/G(S)/G(T) subunit beta-1
MKMSADTRPRKILSTSIAQRRNLSGHFGKLYGLCWGKDSETILSAAQDGKVILWDAFRNIKKHVHSLDSKWALCCDLSPTMKFAAIGGLDMNTVILNVSGSVDRPILLSGHSGYISEVKFMSLDKLACASGDQTVSIWNFEKEKVIGRMQEHQSDVISIANNDDLIVSGSCDKSAKVWDSRALDGIVCNFQSHGGDVNKVRWFPGNSSIIFTGCEDGFARLFDSVFLKRS